MSFLVRINYRKLITAQVTAKIKKKKMLKVLSLQQIRSLH